MPLEIAQAGQRLQEESFGIEEVVDPTGYLAEPRDLIENDRLDLLGLTLANEREGGLADPPRDLTRDREADSPGGLRDVGQRAMEPRFRGDD